MAERTATVRKYRDVLETVIKCAMDFVAKSSVPQTPQSDDRIRSRAANHKDNHPIVRSLLGLSGPQEPVNIPAREQDHTWQIPTHDSTPNPAFRMSAGAVEPQLEASQPFTAYDEIADGLQNGIGHGQGLDPMDYSQQTFMASNPMMWEADQFSMQMLNEMLMLESGP